MIGTIKLEGYEGNLLSSIPDGIKYLQELVFYVLYVKISFRVQAAIVPHFFSQGGIGYQFLNMITKALLIIRRDAVACFIF